MTPDNQLEGQNSSNTKSHSILNRDLYDIKGFKIGSKKLLNDESQQKMNQNVIVEALSSS